MNARLAINRLVVRCRAPRTATHIAARAERVARGALAGACARAAHAVSSRATGVLRIRRLTVRLKFSSDGVDEATLCRVWSEAISSALCTALERGADAGFHVVCAVSTAAWRAQFLGRHLDGEAAGCWEFDEFSDLLALDPVRAARLLVADAPAEAADLLGALDADANLVRLLVQLDAEDVAQVLPLVQLDGPFEDDPAAALRVAEAIGGPSRHDIIALAASPQSAGDARAVAGRIAILLYTRGRTGRGPAFISPSQVVAALTTLGAIVRRLDRPWLESASSLARLDGDERWPETATTLAQMLAGPLPDELVRAVAAWSTAPAERVAALIAAARPIALLASSPLPAPTTTPTAEPPRRIITAAAGLFLLIPSIRALGWDECLRGAAMPASEADRRRRHWLAAIAQQMTTGFDPDCEELEPGLALFAGYGFDADVADYRRFFRETDESEECVPARLERMAEQLFGEIRRRVGPLQGASDDFLQERFVATPGRLIVGPDEVHVVVDRDPYHIALHHAGCDVPCLSVPWLGGRDVSFRLEGLS